MVSFWVLSGSGLAVPGIRKLSCIVSRFNRTLNLSSNPEGLHIYSKVINVANMSDPGRGRIPLYLPVPINM